MRCDITLECLVFGNDAIAVMVEDAARTDFCLDEDGGSQLPTEDSGSQLWIDFPPPRCNLTSK